MEEHEMSEDTAVNSETETGPFELTMARVLGVSPSGYYAWRHRERSA